jgi:hypothetical protein
MANWTLIPFTGGGGGGGTVTSVALSGGTTGLTVTGSPITTSGTITLSGTLAIANGGTGQTTRQAAINALAGTTTSGQYLRGNGTNVVMSAIQAGDIPALNQNTTGTAANVTGIVAIANGGTGATTQQAAINALVGATTSGQYLRGNGTNLILSAIQAGDIPTLNQNTTGTAANVTGVVAAANGGTGLTTPGPSGNVLTSNGTSWISTAPGTGGTVTSVAFSTGTTGLTVTGSPITTTGTITLSGTLAIANGGTGQTTQQAAINALAGSTTSGQFLRGNGTNVQMSAIQITDVPTLNQNPTGTAANVTGVVAAANGGTGLTTPGPSGNVLTSNGTGWISQPSTSSGTVTSVALSGGTTGLTVSGSPITTSGTITLSGTLNTANGGTGLSSYTANRVFYASSTSAIGQSANLTFDGTTLSAHTTTVSTGNFTFGGTGQRIIADMSSATISNRLMFQTSVFNGATQVSAVTNGSGTDARFVAYENNSDVGNSSTALFGVINNETRVSAGITGSGTYRPMTFYTGGLERVKIDQFGNVGVGAANNGNSKLQVWQGTNNYGLEVLAANGGTNSGIASIRLINFANTVERIGLYGNSDTSSTINFSGSLLFTSSGTERYRFSDTGALGINGANYGTAGQVLTSAGSGSSPTWGAGVSSLSTSSGSSQIGFIQAGSGVTQRTVQSKLRDTLSFVDFGADPTGVADSTTAIQAAINYAESVGGAIVSGPPGGTYKLTSTIIFKSMVVIDLNGGKFVQYTNNIPIVSAPAGVWCQGWGLQNGILAFNTEQDGLTTITMNITGTINVGDMIFGASSGAKGWVTNVSGSTVSYKAGDLFINGETIRINGTAVGTTLSAPVSIRCGIGLRLANQSFSWNFMVQALTIIAYDGITCPNTTGSFAFVGQIQNYTGGCNRYAMAIDCDSANGANTNLVLTNCWALAPDPVPDGPPPTSRGFYFNGASQFQWQSIFADKIRDKPFFIQSANGVIGTISLEAATVEVDSDNELNVIHFSDTYCSIGAIKFIGNTFRALNRITANITGTISVGNTITGGTSGASGVVTSVTGSTITFYANSGTKFTVGENILVSAVSRGTVTNSTPNPGTIFLLRGVGGYGNEFSINCNSYEQDGANILNGAPTIYDASFTSLSVGVSGPVWFYNDFARTKRAPANLADFGATKQIRYWNGENRYYTVGMTADAAWNGKTTNVRFAAMTTADSYPTYSPVNTDRQFKFASTAYGTNRDGGLTLYSDDGLGNEIYRAKIRLRTDSGGGGRLSLVGALGGSVELVTAAGDGTETVRLVAAQTGALGIGGTNYGTSGQVLTSNGSFAAPSWSTIPSGSVTSVALSGGTTGLTVSGSPITTSGTITLGGTLAVANGGTGQTTQQAAINTLAGSVTNGAYLRGNGSNVVMSAIQAGDIPTLNQNTTGTAANVTGTVAIANGGTGQTSRQAAINALAGTTTSGQFLRGNGTNILMSAIQAGDIPTLNQNTTGTAANVTGTVAIGNGGTGATTAANARSNLGVPATDGTGATGTWSISINGFASTSGVATTVNNFPSMSYGYVAGQPTYLCGVDGSGNMRVYDLGQITVGYALALASDAELKENITPFKNALDKVLQLNAVYYNLKSDENKVRNVGVIAQNVQEVIPELVSLQSPDPETGEQYLGVKYGNMTAVLIEAIKEQQQTITRLESAITNLIARIETLESKK